MLETSGGRVHFRYRPGTGPAILFLHGLGCSGMSFDSGFANSYLPEDYCLIAPDLLGHGRSVAKVQFSFDMRDQAAVVAELLRVLRPNDFVIVGHSMGTVVGLIVAQLVPGLRAFIAIEGDLLPEDCFLSSRITSVSEDVFINKVFAYSPRSYCDSVGLQPLQSFAKSIYRSAISLVDSARGSDLIELFNCLDCHSAYLYGTSLRHMNTVNQLVDSEKILIDNSSHFLMLDEPDSTYRAISSLVKQIL